MVNNMNNINDINSVSNTNMNNINFHFQKRIWIIFDIRVIP